MVLTMKNPDRKRLKGSRTNVNTNQLPPSATMAARWCGLEAGSGAGLARHHGRASERAALQRRLLVSVRWKGWQS
jgi:hypothetical protein